MGYNLYLNKVVKKRIWGITSRGCVRETASGLYRQLPSLGTVVCVPMIVTKPGAEATGCPDEQRFFDAEEVCQSWISVKKTSKPTLFPDETT